MGIDAELDPAGYIPRWIERRPLDLFKDRVVLPGVAPEIRLDGDKLRAQQSFLCPDHGLHDARQPSVSISKRMDGDDVQVRHRRANHRMAGDVAGFHPRSPLVDTTGARR